MFASNFTLRDTTLKYVRGEDKVKTFAMTKTIASGNTMTNHFCSDCGSLMYRGKLLRSARKHKEKLGYAWRACALSLVASWVP